MKKFECENNDLRVIESELSVQNAELTIPVLNLETFSILREMFAGAFPDAVQSHTNGAKENIKKIEEALDNNDALALVHAAHSIKGASGQFGALNLSVLSQKMEKFGEEGEIEKAKEILDDIKNARTEVEKLMMENM